MYVRREHARGQFLQEVRQLEHHAEGPSALRRLLVERVEPRGRISLRYEQVEDAQSESPPLVFLATNRLHKEPRCSVVEDFVGPDFEGLEWIHAGGRREGDVRRVPASRHESTKAKTSLFLDFTERG